ncbi:MAG: hypothetical protein AAF773_12015 [Cyanobacteria bacterium P01_D01_bin.115]
MKSGWLKLLFINIGLTLGIVFGLNFLIALVDFVVSMADAALSGTAGVEVDPRASLRNYSDNPDLALQHFQEFEALETKYQSFVAWSRQPFAGPTITINEVGDRVHTGAPAVTQSDADVYFFGGSTVWGTGVLDNQTIPAYFQDLSQLATTNKGETAYVSRQSLNSFINLLASNPNLDTVVFYEGVNDVQYHCRADIGAFDHARTTRFQQAIAADSEEIADRLLSPTAKFLSYLDVLFLREIRRVAVDIGEAFAPEREAERIDNSLICDDSPELAEQVAQSLLLHWETAHQIAQARGVELIAVLQPVSYLDDSPVDHLELDAELGKQYEAVYPIVQQLIAASDKPWIWDYTDVFDTNEYVYIDFCHLSGNGNRLIAERLNRDLQQFIPRS